MEQLLPRGYEIHEGVRIKKTVAEGSDWQIYSTSTEASALAILPSLLQRWRTAFSLPPALFAEDSQRDYYVFAGSGLIASLRYGPYPCCLEQIQTLSAAFASLNLSAENGKIYDAIFIEEQALLLPTYEVIAGDISRLYAGWLTSGVDIPVTSFERVCKLVDWMAADELARCVNAAGFAVRLPVTETSSEVKDMEESGHQESTDGLPQGEFSLPGRPYLEQFFRENIIDVVLRRERYQRMGIGFPGATVLHGPPGSGKTYAVEQLAKHLGWPRFDIDSGTVASSFIHETGKKISEIFSKAISAAPSILVIDEMEAFLSSRSAAGSAAVYRAEELAEFLRRIPEAVSNGVLIFAMTNTIDMVDPAILRRGRFDNIIEVGMASAAEIEALLVSRFKELPVDESVDARDISKKLDAHPMSDVAFVLREAGRIAVRQGLELMNRGCFDAALDRLPKKQNSRKIGF